MSVTIPGALADHLAAQWIGDEETAAALDAARRGRGRTLVIEPTSTRVLHVISRHAEHILSIRGAYSRAQIAAARLWIQRAGHAPAILAHRFEDTKEAYNATQCRADIRDGDVLVIEREGVVGFLRSAWPAAVTVAHGELHTIKGDPRTLDDGRYVASVEAAEKIAAEHVFALAENCTPMPEPIVARMTPRREDLDRIKAKADADREAYRAETDDRIAAEHRAHGAPVPPAVQARIGARTAPSEQAVERRVVEGVIVAHNGRTKGTAPKHSTDSDARAALDALGDLRLAEVTDHTDIAAEPGDLDHQPDAWGFLAEPRGNGRIALYWLESGRYVRPDGEPWAVELQIGADKLSAAGWRVEPHTRRCVMAWRPAE